MPESDAWKLSPNDTSENIVTVYAVFMLITATDLISRVGVGDLYSFSNVCLVVYPGGITWINYVVTDALVLQHQGISYHTSGNTTHRIFIILAIISTNLGTYI